MLITQIAQDVSLISSAKPIDDILIIKVHRNNISGFSIGHIGVSSRLIGLCHLQTFEDLVYLTHLDKLLTN